MDDWMVMYKRLVAYKQKHNNTRVPKTYREDPKLANWVSTQRNKCKDKDRIDLLNEVGFDWKLEHPDDCWMAMYKRLVAYKQKHNTTRVRIKYEEDPKLASWVSTQRFRCTDKDRIDLLNEIGFEWRLQQNDDWIVMYERLVAYKQKHNTTRVPRQYKEDPKLGNWVDRQRYKCKDKNRIDLLNEIGFAWKVHRREDWMVMYNRLIAYKQKHNTTRVPKGYREDPKLSNWVDRQRHKCKDKERIDLLNEMGFEWRVPRSNDNWIVMYKRLVAYEQKRKTTSDPQGYIEDPQLAKWVKEQRKRCKDKKRIGLIF